jgi:hypothetical protein
MRPTTSSSSKTADKTPITPPRKQSVPTFVKTPASEGSAKKAVAKMAESVKPKDNHLVNKPAIPKNTTASTPKQTAKPVQATAKEIAPVVAQAETAEKAIEATAAPKDTATTPIVEEPETNAAEEAIAVPIPVATEAAASNEPAPVIEPELVAKPTETAKEAPAPIEEGSEPVADAPEPVEEVKLANGHGPVVSDDPDKVEDIEDVIQQATETPVEDEVAEKTAEKKSTNPVEASVEMEKETSEEKLTPEEVDGTDAA